MKKLIFALLLICLAISARVLAEESSTVKIYFDGPKESVAPGSQIVIGVFLDTKVPINAFDVGVSYRTDKLQFLGSDNTNSIVNIWKTKPEGGAPGSVEFSGGILKSFTGSGGLLVRLSFRVLATNKATDTFNLSFSKNDIYLADGKGTKAEVSTPSFSLSVKEDAEVISSPIEPFQSTPTDILIEEGLQDFEPGPPVWKLLLAVLVFIVLVFCLVWVYNKLKRKQ